MKKILFALNVILLAISCQKFDDSALWEKLNDHETRFSDFNIPSGIVMLSQEFEDVLKHDTLIFDIRVNPSDFPLKKEHIGLMCATNTYSVCEPGKDIMDCAFDPAAKSDFRVLDIAPLADYEGGYRIAVAVNGNGNYFEDAEIFVTAGAKDSKDTFRSVCSATPCKVSVIPAIEDGLLVESPEQSFFETIVDSTSVKTEKKDFILGVWSNHYKDKEGRIRVYDRTKLNVLSICDSLAKSAIIKNDYFQEYGLVQIEIDSTNAFWQGELEKFRNDESTFTELKGMTLGVSRGFEHKDIPFNLKVHYPCMIQILDSMTTAEAKDKRKAVYDIDAELSRCGLSSAGYAKPLNCNHQETGATKGIIAEFHEESRQIEIHFGISRALPKSYYKYLDKYSIGGQDNEGKAILNVFIPNTIRTALLNVHVNLEITFTDL